MAVGVQLTFEVKDWFFDRQQVEDAIGRSRRRVLGRAGAMVRKIARSSIKKAAWRSTGKATRGRKPSGTIYVHEYLPLKTAISDEGQPPKYHTGKGEFGIRNILFAYDQTSDTVVVGPVGRGGSSVPETLEYGGTTRTKIPKWAQAARKRYGSRTIRKRIQPRPFMRPALEKFQGTYPELWRDTLR